MTISDHPLLPSGVGTQTKYIIEGLLRTGKFRVISLGGAIDHPNYEPTTTAEWGEDWVIFPVKGYGNQQQLRQFLLQFKPDILYFMTDPRFYEWLWHMEDEIRTNVPMVYYHVWDNYPYPEFNKKFYDSNDKVVAISKVTSDIVKTVAPEVDEQYIPHAVDTNIFKKFVSTEDLDRVQAIKRQFNMDGKTVFFWNNRNARRKQSGSLVWWFKEFLDIVGHDKAVLLMHTELNDPHGQPLNFLAEKVGMTDGQVQFSVEKVSPADLAVLYNLADVTVNIADAEGFGLATLESLACETPIIVTMTGGLQEQVTDGENWFGVGIEPSSKAVIGSQTVPYIYEDRVSKEDVINAMVKLHEMTPRERSALGKEGRGHIEKNYRFETYQKSWVKCMLDLHKKSGSWKTRKNYTKWSFREL
jgi:glycosyltransferase involved in cell wall biosynthesis